jgi:hypothetical protein
MIAPIHQEILANLQVMPLSEVAEVLDFVEFLRTRHRQRLLDVQNIDALCGKYQHRLSSSGEFAQKKRAEIQLEEEKWQRQ